MECWTLSNEVKERPILMSAPMVRAILGGTKTQTRRVAKKWHILKGHSRDVYHQKGATIADWEMPYFLDSCPYGKVGDRLYVKESAWMWCERRPDGVTKAGRPKWHYVPDGGMAWYTATSEKPNYRVPSPDTGNEWDWRFKIGRFLPRSAARIFVRVVSVRVERLQDISEADAIEEGIERSALGWRDYNWAPGVHDGLDAVNSYQTLWQHINGLESWDANPFVWVIEFAVVEVE